MPESCVYEKFSAEKFPDTQARGALLLGSSSQFFPETLDHGARIGTTP
jgi:hypothetical protein